VRAVPAFALSVSTNFLYTPRHRTAPVVCPPILSFSTGQHSALRFSSILGGASDPFFLLLLAATWIHRPRLGGGAVIASAPPHPIISVRVTSRVDRACITRSRIAPYAASCVQLKRRSSTHRECMKNSRRSASTGRCENLAALLLPRRPVNLAQGLSPHSLLPHARAAAKRYCSTAPSISLLHKYRLPRYTCSFRRIGEELGSSSLSTSTRRIACRHPRGRLETAVPIHRCGEPAQTHARGSKRVSAPMRANPRADEETWGLGCADPCYDFAFERGTNSEAIAVLADHSGAQRFLRGRALRRGRALDHHTRGLCECRARLRWSTPFLLATRSRLLDGLRVCAPSKSILDLGSGFGVKRRMKDKLFAKGVSRDDMRKGAEEWRAARRAHWLLHCRTARACRCAGGARLALKIEYDWKPAHKLLLWSWKIFLRG